MSVNANGSHDELLKKWVRDCKPSIDSSMDAVVVINSSRQIVYYNLSAKSFFGLPIRAFGKQPDFCALIEIAECRDKCCMREVLDKASMLKLAEVPAKKRAEKVRISLRAVPIFDGPKTSRSSPIGAIVSLRDTSGEVVLQAKYHKVLEMLEQKQDQLAEMEDRLKDFKASLRRTRMISNP